VPSLEFKDGIYTVTYQTKYEYGGVIIAIDGYGSESVPYLKDGEDPIVVSVSNTSFTFDIFSMIDNLYNS
jgi:hypothetical protein